MSSPNPDPVLVAAVDPSARPTRRTFTAEYRQRIIDEYERAPHGEKSAVLRREGLYQSQLREWGYGGQGAAAGAASASAFPCRRGCRWRWCGPLWCSLIPSGWCGPSVTVWSATTPAWLSS